MSVQGSTPNGEKELTNATFLLPLQIVFISPYFRYDVGNSSAMIGLLDGFCSSPIIRNDLNWNDYDYTFNNPESWKEHIQKNNLYPSQADAKPNWFFYGYYNPGPKHLAFDLWAKEGKKVHAPVPGKLVKGKYDHIVGIVGVYGQFDLNHIMLTVDYGTEVEMGDIIGTVGADNHVHIELYNPLSSKIGSSLILSCFPGITPDDILISPLDGQPVPVLPNFGP